MISWQGRRLSWQSRRLSWQSRRNSNWNNHLLVKCWRWTQTKENLNPRMGCRQVRL